MGLPTHCDVVIIGGGIAGLTSAALLSKAGLHVELFETESQAGGCLASFHRKGFTFDASLEWLNQCRPGGFLARIHQAIGNDGPRYPWFIGRDPSGRRISHVHVALEGDDSQWDRVLFRDHLRRHPDVAREYDKLKRDLAARFPDNREAYTLAKTAFITGVIDAARRESRA